MEILKRNGRYVIRCAHGFESEFGFSDVKPLCSGCPCCMWALVKENGEERIVFFHCHGAEPYIGTEPSCKVAEHDIEMKCSRCGEYKVKVLPHLYGLV